MTKFLHFFGIVLLSIFISSCSNCSRSGKKHQAAVAESSVSDLVLSGRTPTRVGLSELFEEETTYTDSGKMPVYAMHYTIAFEIPPFRNDLKLERSLFCNSKTDKEAVREKQVYQTLKLADPADLNVTVKAGRIVRISTADRWGEGKNEFIPGEVLWEL